MTIATKRWVFRPFMAEGYAGSTGAVAGRYFGAPVQVRSGFAAGAMIGAVRSFRAIRSRVLAAVLRELDARLSLQRKTVNAFAGTILHSLGVSDTESIVFRDPNTAVVTSRDAVLRIPFDRASEARCRLNARVLAALETTPLAGFVPRPLGGGSACGLPYYRESRLPGTVPAAKGRETRSLTRTAAEFMTAFHLQTAREITIDGRRFHRLFARDLRRLDAYLDGPGRLKRELLERSLRRRFLYAPCKTVWLHGDCTFENLLFDPSRRYVRGVTGWGLARRDGLPLLDIFSLLMQAQSRSTRRPVEDVFRERCFVGRWDTEEGTIIDRYVSLLHLPREYVRPLLVMFWVTYTVRRLERQRSGAVPEKVRNEIEGTLEAACHALGGHRGR